MYPIDTILLISFAFAFIAFIIASNIFGRFWQWILTAVATFALFALLLTFKLETLFIIATCLLFALVIILLIAKRKK